MAEPVVVTFPLRGEWAALNTPAARVPSHGTDYFGQTYAFDFVTLDENGSPYRKNLFLHVVGRIEAAHCYAWERPVYAPFEGEVVSAGDGWPDRLRLNAIVDLARVTFARDRSTTKDYRPLAGNFVLLRGESAFALYGHLRQGSVTVKPGERVTSETVIGRVGNSGNTTMPHLHFHLMDGADPYTAKGLPCAFDRYEAWRDGAWQEVRAGVPEAFERIRY